MEKTNKLQDEMKSLQFKYKNDPEKLNKEMMAMLFAVRIVEERTKFDQVPRLLKQDVADILVKDFGMPELVPAEFGGTASAV